MGESGLSQHNALIEYIPGQDQTAAELWIVDNSATKKILRCTAGSSTTATLTNQSLKDNISGEAYNVSSAVINGKHYLAYKSGVNRLHVFDPNNATANTVRRAGSAHPQPQPARMMPRARCRSRVRTRSRLPSSRAASPFAARSSARF
jgi:hypothetical protein